ncbi:ATP-binding protein [Fodinisporobacter ferrooxydans]|uniref:histidine kinase n=1 Tax=Fodinisporobacter ferrooxydans TaxID=2901836 RepID=A0ABY4CJB1_9BACL|nr:ATP-binding protein [Alicyclobacillaceae bacterium MYW30-H2]
MKRKKFQLTENIQLLSSGHILYVYEDLDAYVDNAVAYIVAGVEQNNMILLIETEEIRRRIYGKIGSILPSDKLEWVHYVDNDEFYGTYGNFYCDKIVDYFGQLLEPLLRQTKAIRSWAGVKWTEQDDIVNMLETFECRANAAVLDIGVMAVCAYNGNTVPAILQNKLMRHHEYFMTDEEFARSPLYSNEEDVIFPSLSTHMKIKSEIDLYKQKLDFAHVVSHEVRNPLTVIKGYVFMLLEQGTISRAEDRKRLREIADYVDAIDQEMQHIIHTEQMLSNKELWQIESLHPSSVIREILDIMSVKSRIQGVQLIYTLCLHGSEMMSSNRIGLRLIVSNIVGNAIKYSEEGSAVKVNVELDGDFIRLSVKDQGSGMSSHQIKRLFRKYGKLNNQKEGQGIGLYMVKQLVEYFKGTIEVESKVGRGTEVIIRLPMYAADPLPPEETGPNSIHTAAHIN